MFKKIAILLFSIMMMLCLPIIVSAQGDEGGDPGEGNDIVVAFENAEETLDMTEYCSYYSKNDYNTYGRYTLYLASGEAAFFSTSNKAVARIEEENETSVEIILRNSGNVIIRAHNEDGNTVASCRLNITASIRDIDVRPDLSDEDQNEYGQPQLYPGKTLQLKAKQCPSFAPDVEVSWSSTNENYAEVDENGLVTLKKQGAVTIIAEATEGNMGEYPIVWSGYFTEGDYTYRVINADEVAIASYNGNDKEIVIPEEIEGYDVTAIDEGGYFGGAFSKINKLEKVTIPASITNIGEEAFYYCDRLRTVVYNCDADIPSEAFYGCKYLNEIEINGSPRAINPYAFDGCTNLTSISLPEGLEIIGKGAFRDAKLKRIDLPQSLTTIEKEAFNSCSIENFHLGKNVENISPTGGVMSFSVSDENTVYTSIDGVLFNKEKDTMVLYPGASSERHYSVPIGTTSIGNKAFAYNYDILQIDFPETVESIGEEALPDSDRLTILLPKSLKAVEASNMESIPKKVYYRGSEQDWDNVYIDYYENDGLKNNQNIVFNYKKTGINVGKTNIDFTFAERPEVSLTYSDGKPIPKEETEIYINDYNGAYAYTAKKGNGTVIYAYSGNPNKPSKVKVCLVAGGFAKTLTVNVTGPTPVNKLSITGIGTKVYTGKAIKQNYEVKIGSNYVGSDNYTVKYQSNTNVGVGKIIFTGKNACTGTVTKTFKIIPQDTYFTSSTPAKRAVTIRWKKLTKQLTGYQIQYGLKKNFSGAKTITIKNYKTTYRKLSGLKSKKRYYVRIRTYKKVGSATYYSKWKSWSVVPK